MKPVVVHISNWHTNWIIGGIFREAAEACALEPAWQIHSTSRRDFLYPRVLKGRFNPQLGELNVYAHQDTYFSVFAHESQKLQITRNRVYFTHLNLGQTLSENQITSLRFCERILVQNVKMEEYLLTAGISKSVIVRVPGAVNRDIYKPIDTIPERGFVLFAGNFKYRKNPDLIAQVIASMPDIDFVIHGQNWEAFPAEFLKGLPNLKRIDFKLKRQPELMRRASLYVSLSLVEGGPYTVLEALASGTPVVATDTGFCAEFINHSNGQLLRNPPNLDLVENSIRQSLKLKKNVWNQDLLKGKWQWKDLGQLIYD